jgi:cytochrome c-type biogenesis protein CcmH/NrfG
MSLPFGADRGLWEQSRRGGRKISRLVIAATLILVCVCAIVFVLGIAAASNAQHEFGDDKDNPTAAVKSLKSAIVADPGHVDFYLQLADLYMSSELNDFEAAVVILNRSIVADPDNPAAYLKLGTAEMMLGHSKSALRALEEYKRLSTSAHVDQPVGA